MFVVTFTSNLLELVWDWKLKIVIVDTIQSSTRACASKSQCKLKFSWVPLTGAETESYIQSPYEAEACHILPPFQNKSYDLENPWA